MMIKFFLRLFLIAVLTPNISFGEAPSAHVAMLIVPTLSSTLKLEQRRLAAGELNVYFENLDDYIPSLRPSEKEWIDKERATCDRLLRQGNGSFGPRFDALANSTELAQLNLKEALAEMISLSINLKGELPLHEEISRWNRLSSLMMKDVFQENFRAFANSGKVNIPKNANTLIGNGKTQDVGAYELVGKGIVALIVQPYLDSLVARR